MQIVECYCKKKRERLEGFGMLIKNISMGESECF